MSNTLFERVIVYYTEWQDIYQDLRRESHLVVEFRKGLPQYDDFQDTSRPKLVILDDLMHESASSNQSVVQLFTKGSHYRNLSIFFLTQNLFHQGRGQRDISLNANYIVVFKNPRDRAQIRYLARQIFPENPLFLQEAYNDATRTGHDYVGMDLKQSTPEEYRFRTNIFPHDRQQIAYEVKKKFKWVIEKSVR